MTSPTPTVRPRARPKALQYGASRVGVWVGPVGSSAEVYRLGDDLADQLAAVTQFRWADQDRAAADPCPVADLHHRVRPVSGNAGTSFADAAAVAERDRSSVGRGDEGAGQQRVLRTEDAGALVVALDHDTRVEDVAGAELHPHPDEQRVGIQNHRACGCELKHFVNGAKAASSPLSTCNHPREASALHRRMGGV